MADYLGKDTFKLGFGLMRLPKNPDGSTDIPQVCEMADRFIAAGGTYFDTAFVYDNGRSEEAFKAAVADRYPRNRYTICTKLNAWKMCHDEESAKQQFYTSLERVGVGYFDYYLLHGLMRNNYTKYDEYHLWDFVKEQKEKGLIRHYGFSFHADPGLLREILQKHREVDLVQLQLNYSDWENPGIAARECWEIARAYGKAITVMEPLKGGALADPIPAVKRIFREASPDLPVVSWGIRYAASLDGVITVLSGMSNLRQMEENLSFMKDFKPLNETEQAVILKAQQALNADKAIPCTGCHYCVDGCPMGIPIPEIIAVANRQHNNEGFRQVREYNIATFGKGKASQCARCGQCESVCPQHLGIVEYLRQCAEKFEA